MFKKDKEKKDEFPGVFEEFRSVRVYSNINGKEERYGYEYRRTPDGKEEYREIGKIPEDFGNDIMERMENLERAFSIDIPILGAHDSIFNRMLSSFGNFFTPHPALATPELKPMTEQEETKDNNLQYDIQVDPKTKTAHIIIELPGFTKKDVKLKFTNKGLYLKAQNKRKGIEATIPLKDLDVIPETMKATMNNGILEVSAKVNEDNADEGKEIPVN